MHQDGWVILYVRIVVRYRYHSGHYKLYLKSQYHEMERPESLRRKGKAIIV